MKQHPAENLLIISKDDNKEFFVPNYGIVRDPESHVERIKRMNQYHFLKSIGIEPDSNLLHKDDV